MNAHQRFDAIVVLGGGVHEKGSLRPTPVIGEISLVRTLCGVDLFEHGLSNRLVMSAGDASILRTGPEESVEMKRFAVRMGISPEAILTETRSRTTHENAVEIKRTAPMTNPSSWSHRPVTCLARWRTFKRRGSSDAGAVWIRPGRSLRPFWRDTTRSILSHERMHC
jgi:hypothetical protein